MEGSETRTRPSFSMETNTEGNRTRLRLKYITSHEPSVELPENRASVVVLTSRGVRGTQSAS